MKSLGARDVWPEAADAIRFARSDAGNAELFADLHATDVRFDYAANIWRIWTGHHWATDRDGAVRRMAKDAMRHRLELAATLVHDEDRKNEARWAIQSESRRGLDALLALAQSEQPLAVTGDGWDTHPTLLAVPNGIVDLESGSAAVGLSRRCNHPRGVCCLRPWCRLPALGSIHAGDLRRSSRARGVHATGDRLFVNRADDRTGALDFVRQRSERQVHADRNAHALRVGAGVVVDHAVSVGELV